MQKIHQFFRSLFSPLLDFRVRLFNILALGGTVISLIMIFLLVFPAMFFSSADIMAVCRPSSCLPLFLPC